MGDVVDPVFRDEIAEVYCLVRDATVCNESISSAEKLAVLELIKFELLTNMHEQVHPKDC